MFLLYTPFGAPGSAEAADTGRELNLSDCDRRDRGREALLAQLDHSSQAHGGRTWSYEDCAVAGRGGTFGVIRGMIPGVARARTSAGVIGAAERDTAKERLRAW